jgi:hypothetical protein
VADAGVNVDLVLDADAVERLTSKVRATASPSRRFSFFLTSAFTGRRYAPSFRSGKMEVIHLVFPMAAVTGIDPQPRRFEPYSFFSSADAFFGTVMKCRAPTIAAAFDDFLCGLL